MDNFSCLDGICDGGSPAQLGECIAYPPLGAACTGLCATGLFCDSSGHRVAVKPDGVPCANDTECGSGVCNFVADGGTECGFCR
jgi:hypothetical protein